jgi:protein TonB
MAHAYADTPRLQLDAKRIAATSGVIALHAGLLMMLMMPPAMPAPIADQQDASPWIVPEIKIPPLRPPPIETKPKPQPPQQATQHVETKNPDPPPIVYKDSTSAQDIIATTIDPPHSDEIVGGSTETAFVQLTTTSAPPPPFPSMAIQRRWTGTVQLRIHVDASGKPIEVEIEQGSGHTILDIAAQRFVQAHWRFAPASSGGVPTDAWGVVSIDYVLQ